MLWFYCAVKCVPSVCREQQSLRTSALGFQGHTHFQKNIICESYVTRDVYHENIRDCNWICLNQETVGCDPQTLVSVTLCTTDGKFVVCRISKRSARREQWSLQNIMTYHFWIQLNILQCTFIYFHTNLRMFSVVDYEVSLILILHINP